MWFHCIVMFCFDALTIDIGIYLMHLTGILTTASFNSISWSGLTSLGEKSSSWPWNRDLTWTRTVTVVNWFTGKYTSFLPVFTTPTVTSCSLSWSNFLSVCRWSRMWNYVAFVSSTLFTISLMTLYPIIGSSATVESLDTNMGTLNNGVGKGPPSMMLFTARPVRVAFPNNSYKGWMMVPGRCCRRQASFTMLACDPVSHHASIGWSIRRQLTRQRFPIRLMSCDT